MLFTWLEKQYGLVKLKKKKLPPNKEVHFWYWLWGLLGYAVVVLLYGLLLPDSWTQSKRHPGGLLHHCSSAAVSTPEHKLSMWKMCYHSICECSEGFRFTPVKRWLEVVVTVMLNLKPAWQTGHAAQGDRESLAKGNSRERLEGQIGLGSTESTCY